MKDVFVNFLTTSATIKQQMAADEALLEAATKAAQMLTEAVNSGGTIYACGNGGSACDAMHFTEELVARYKREREGIRAMHFQDGGVLSCWSNDYDYSDVFKRQAETFCKSNDVLIGISTSGNSENIIKAVEVAKKNSTYTIGLSGKGGGQLASICDTTIIVPSSETDRIQEAHITLIHAFCEILERE